MRSNWQLALALAVFVPWFLGTLAVQVYTLASAVAKRPWTWLVRWKRWDLLDLCPRFSFFSWLPTAHYHLFVRDRYAGADRTAVTPWRLLALPRRPWFRFLWNPARRVRFSLEDAARGLVSHLTREVSQPQNAEGRLDGFAYLFLRRYIANHTAFPAARERQFLLAQRRNGPGPGELEPLFVSPFFSIDAGESVYGNPLSKLGDNDHAA